MAIANLKEKIYNIIQIPTLPSIAAEMMEMTENPNTTAAALGQMIAKDQVLTAKVLKIANSPFYGFSRKIATIDFAIIVLGFDTLKEVILSVSLISTMNKKKTKNFDVEQYWDHALACGVVARALAKNYGYRVLGEVFVAGLLHDIGILLLNQFFPSEFKKMLNFIDEKNCDLETAEQDILGSTHAEIGSWLADSWNFPSQLIEAIAYHHHPSNAQKHIDVVSMIHIAEVMCQNLQKGKFDLEKGLQLETDVLQVANFKDTKLTLGYFDYYKEIFEEEITRARAIIS